MYENLCKCHKRNRTKERLDSPLADVNDKHVGFNIIVEIVWRMEILTLIPLMWRI